MNNDLIEQYIPLANRIAHDNSRKYHTIPFDEFQSAAYFGLVDAASKFDCMRGVPFGSYARIRISGEIISMITKLFAQPKCISIDELESSLYNQETFSYVEDLLLNLPTRYKKVLIWYFCDGFSMGEIGVKIGVSESRISQIISKCKNKIKETHSNTLKGD